MNVTIQIIPLIVHVFSFNISKKLKFCKGVVLPCDVYCPNWKEDGVEHKLT